MCWFQVYGFEQILKKVNLKTKDNKTMVKSFIFQKQYLFWYMYKRERTLQQIYLYQKEKVYNTFFILSVFKKNVWS